MTTQRLVTLADIVVDPDMQMRDALHADTVSSYIEDFDHLPPVLLFDTPDGLLLADGFHRYEAAQHLGRTEIAAIIEQGTRTDAVDAAIKANMQHGIRYTRAERGRAIRLFEEHHQDWSTRRVQDELCCDFTTIARIRQAREARAAHERVLTSQHLASSLSETHYREIGSAKPEQFQPIADAAQDRKWTIGETQQAVRDLKDERVPDDYKERLLAGEADPVVVRQHDDDVSFAPHPDTLRREVARNLSTDDLDYQSSYLSAVAALARLETLRPDIIAQALTPEQKHRALDSQRGLPQHIRFLQNILREIDTLRPNLRMITDAQT